MADAELGQVDERNVGKERGGCAAPRLELGLYPTPLQELDHMPGLTDDGKRFFVKREDLIGVGLGGNKIRRMEYLLGEALASGCDCLVVAGGAKSNQTVAAASCAARACLPVHLVIPKTTGSATRGLSDLLGAEIHYVEESTTTSLNRGIRAVCADLKERGRTPYIIRPGTDSVLGVLGYVDAMRELYAQAADLGIHLDHVLCCGGTGVTYAGVLLGTRLYSPETTATAVSIGRRFKHAETLCRMARETSELGGYHAEVREEDVHIHFSCGKGASEPTTKGKDAMRIMASEAGIFLDLLFTGKAFAGVLDLNRQGYFAPGSNIAFVHTGGMVTLMSSL